MGNYSHISGSVRVDFFKPSGKWKYTEAMNMDEFYFELLIEDAFKKALTKHLGTGLDTKHRGLVAVCLDPYHKFEYPQMMLIPEEGL